MRNRRHNGRYNNSRSGGSRWMHLHYGGVCKVCGGELNAGDHAFWDAAARTVTCDSLDCAQVDGLVTIEPRTGPWDQRTELRVLTPQRVGPAAPVAHQRAARVRTFTLSSGAVLSVNAGGRCEDAPCCGCCT